MIIWRQENEDGTNKDMGEFQHKARTTWGVHKLISNVLLSCFIIIHEYCFKDVI